MIDTRCVRPPHTPSCVSISDAGHVWTHVKLFLSAYLSRSYLYSHTTQILGSPYQRNLGRIKHSVVNSRSQRPHSATFNFRNQFYPDTISTRIYFLLTRLLEIGHILGFQHRKEQPLNTLCVNMCLWVIFLLSVIFKKERKKEKNSTEANVWRRGCHVSSCQTEEHMSSVKMEAWCVFGCGSVHVRITLCQSLGQNTQCTLCTYKLEWI